MNILFFTDFHIKITRPISRTDEDFYKTCMEKFDFIIQQSKIINPDIIVFGGDLFDKPNVSNIIIIDVIKRIKELNNKFYLIIGNHDISGYNKETITNSSIGVLIETNICKILDELIIDNVRIKGMHCYSKEVFDDYKEGYYNILFAHKPITTINIPNKISIDDLKKTCKYDMVISGDIHMPHLVEENNKFFINPGAVIRNSISEKNRIPQILNIIINNQEIKYNFIQIPHKKNIFVLEENKKDLNFMENYINKISQIKLNKANLKDQIQEYIINNNVSKEIEDAIWEYYKQSNGGQL